MKIKSMALALALLAGATLPAQAGFILAGTDADDHGSATGTTNNDGWFFMQRSIENLASAGSTTNGSTTVVTLGSSSTALNAANSAFNNSSLTGSWNMVNIDGAADIAAFFDGSAATNVNNTGIIMMDSAGNVAGGASAAELAEFTTNANVINTFLANGGSLFSQANGYGWVSALLPNLVVNPGQNSGIALTAAGNVAFPGLTNADLSAGPYHNTFSNTGSVPVLGIQTASTGLAVIIGSSGGSITNPNPVSAPSTLVLLGLSLLGLRLRFRKNT